MDIPTVPEIVNITGTINLPGPMPLNLYSEFLPCSSYDASKFAALKMCSPSPYYTALVFKCGKIVCIGCSSPMMLKEAITSIVDKLNQFEDTEKYVVPKITVENIVACSSLKRELCLRRIKNESLFYIHYEPEIFPGLSINLETEFGTIRSKAFRKEVKEKLAIQKKNWPTLADVPAQYVESYAKNEALVQQFSRDKRKHMSIKLVCFQTGKINIVGCKSFVDVDLAYTFLKKLANQPYFGYIKNK